MATLNKKCYMTILQHLQEAVQKKQQELWWECSWFVCHNNALVHIVLSFQLLTPKTKLHWFDRPLYSPDLSPVDFFLFTELNTSLKGGNFASV